MAVKKLRSERRDSCRATPGTMAAPRMDGVSMSKPSPGRQSRAGDQPPTAGVCSAASAASVALQPCRRARPRATRLSKPPGRRRSGARSSSRPTISSWQPPRRWPPRSTSAEKAPFDRQEQGVGPAAGDRGARIGATVEQQPDEYGIAVHHREEQRRDLTADGEVRIGPGGEERRGGGRGAFVNGVQQRRPPLAAVDAIDCLAGAHQPFDGDDIVLPRRGHQRRQAVRRKAIHQRIDPPACSRIERDRSAFERRTGGRTRSQEQPKQKGSSKENRQRNANGKSGAPGTSLYRELLLFLLRVRGLEGTTNFRPDS